MIKAILVFNNHGKPRLSKFYEHVVCLTIMWLLFQMHFKLLAEEGRILILYHNLLRMKKCSNRSSKKHSIWYLNEMIMYAISWKEEGKLIISFEINLHHSNCCQLLG